MTLITPKYHDTPAPLTPEERDVFVKARALIEDPEHHFQGAHALSDTNRLVEPTDPTACRFCGIGALLRVAGCDTQLDEPAQPLLARLLLVTEIVMDDDRVAFTNINDGLISDIQFDDELRSLTPHQRVLYIYDKVLE